jgi:hypothetical protein
MAGEIFPEEHCDFSTYLVKKKGELSLAHAQMCRFLIMEQCCFPW